jgi:hypothetical protein
MDSIFGREFSHEERELAIAGHHDWRPVEPPNILMGAATVHFDYEFGVCHLSSFPPKIDLELLLIFTSNVEQGRLFLGVSAEFFHFIYRTLLPT